MARKLMALGLRLGLLLPVAACGGTDDQEFVETPPAVEEEARDRGDGY